MRQDPGDLSEVFPDTISDDSESEDYSNTGSNVIVPSTDSAADLESGRAIRKPTRPMPVFAPVKTPLKEKGQSEVVPQKEQAQDKECQTDPVYFTESVKIITTWREDGRKIRKIEKKMLL